MFQLLNAEMEKGKNAWNAETDEKFKNLRLEMSQLKTKYAFFFVFLCFQ